MNWHTPSSGYSRTAWGGRIGLQPSSVVGKESFFRVAYCGGRSYLLDPDNGAVIIHGIQHVRPENLLLIRRLSVLDTVVRRNGVKRLANC